MLHMQWKRIPFFLSMIFIAAAVVVTPNEETMTTTTSQKLPHLRGGEIKRNRGGYEGVIQNFLELQQVLRNSVDNKSHLLVGNMSWLAHMCAYFSLVARKPSIKQICEVGFGCGHSSTLFLTSNIQANMTSFDIFPKNPSDVRSKEMAGFRDNMHKYQTAAVEWIRQKFPNRFTNVAGHSLITIPTFASNNPDFKCDLIYIDGSHQTKETIEDTRNFKKLAHAGTILLFDDFENSDVDAAYNELIKEKVILPKAVECISGEVLIDPRFGHPNRDKLDDPKKYCQTRYIFDA